MAIEGFTWKIIKPPLELSALIERFWMLSNNSDLGHEIAILPDWHVNVFCNERFYYIQFDRVA